MSNAAFQQQLTQWRHALHRHPETGFEELHTSDFGARVLGELGLDVQRGIGGTGSGVIGLRADMDALNIHEQAGDRPHASQTAGKMHACGHDGHMAMVLGAAKLLCERRDFNGTVRFIFQPAEEHGRGAKAMIFVPSVQGISHNPAERTAPGDIGAGAEVFYNTMLQLAQSAGPDIAQES